MDIAVFVQKIRDLVGAVRAGNYLVATLLILDLIKTITAVFPPQNFTVQALTSVDYSRMSLDELTAELDNYTQPAARAAPEPFVGEKLLPILVALLKKLLGL